MTTYTSDGILRCHELPKGEIRFEIPLIGTVAGLCFFPDASRFVLSTVHDGRIQVQVRDSQNGRIRQHLLGKQNGGGHVVIHPLSGEVFVGNNAAAWRGPVAPEWQLPMIGKGGGHFWGQDDRFVAQREPLSLRLYQLRPGEPPVPDELPSSARPGFVSAPQSEIALLVPVRRAKISFALTRATPEGVETIASYVLKDRSQRWALNQNATRMAGSWTDVVRVFNATSGKFLAEMSRLPEAENGKQIVNYLEWMASNTELIGLVTVGLRERGGRDAIVVWDSSDGKVLRHQFNPTTLHALAVSPDGTLLAEAGTDRRVRIRDCQTLEIVQEFRAHDGTIGALAWHPSLPVLATASEDLTVRFWNLETGERIVDLAVLDDRPVEMSFSPTGKRFTVSDTKTIRIWELKSAQDPRLKRSSAKQ
jgi:hypothetical protein